MKKIRVFQNVRKQRIVSGTLVKYLGTVLLFLFLLPYIITAMFHNIEISGNEAQDVFSLGKGSAGSIFVENNTPAGSERIPLEIYLMDKLSRVMSEEFEPEALKAQAVLLRTALIEQLWINSGMGKGNIIIQDTEYGSREIPGVFQQAVAATEGIYLIYNQLPAKTAFFAVSNGMTRSASEVLDTDEYPYLDIVVCSRDFLSDDYSSSISIGKREFTLLWEKATGQSLGGEIILDDIQTVRDSLGYVKSITYQESALSGEEFRLMLGLNSACFQMEEQNQKILFNIRGVGHGLGMSQFGANELAKTESDYVEILEYFFPGTQFTKIE